MTEYGWDMIGTKGGQPPRFTVAGRLYSRPAITHNLPYGHFAVSDNLLRYEALQERLEQLTALIVAHYEADDSDDEIQNLEDIDDE